MTRGISRFLVSAVADHLEILDKRTGDLTLVKNNNGVIEVEPPERSQLAAKTIDEIYRRILAALSEPKP